MTKRTKTRKGGKRPGAGRPRGAKGKATIERELRLRESAERAKAEGVSPLEVMLGTMRKKWAAGDDDGAASVAKDAAPYVHPRLATLDGKLGVDLTPQVVVVPAKLPAGYGYDGAAEDKGNRQ